MGMYKDNESGTDMGYYVHTDYLGSVIALSDNYGFLVEEYAYDAWGKRRGPNDWSYFDGREEFICDRGFTGHEHLHEFDLINMNGRVYDQALGMFLSPDPVLQSPGNALNYNRYSYCFNNPLRYTDPSGYLSARVYGMILYNLLHSEHGGMYSSGGGGSLSFFTNSDVGGDAHTAGYEYGLQTNSTSQFEDVNNNAYNYYKANSRNMRTVMKSGKTIARTGTASETFFNSYFSHFAPKDEAANEGGVDPYIKSITVDETTQTLSMTWDMQQKGVGDVTVGGYNVSTGKRNNTPNGTYTVTWKKPHLSPPHECCRFAVNITGAFFLHTYECSNPIWTRPASAGCVRIMDPAVAERIYNNIKIGVTQVTITGEWPGFQ